MATITFNTEDQKSVLLAVGNLIKEILGEAPQVAIPKSDASEESESTTTESNSTVVDINAGKDAGHLQATASQDAGGANGAQPAAEVDEKGVGFDAKFCSKAKIPFYASGKTQGQWKKRQGVDPTAYDAWYAEQLAKLPPPSSGADDDVDTAAAFGANGQAAGAEVVPKDAGEFMGWVAEKQAASLITQDQIGQAYLDAGITVPDLFPPNEKDAIEAAVSAVYAILVALI